MMKEFHQTAAMNHRFAIGTMVDLNRTVPLSNAVPGPYEVLAKLPERDGELQYRVKSQHELYQRIIQESDLPFEP